MGLIRKVTQADVKAATVKFLAQGGMIDHTVEFPEIQKSSKSYGQMAEERRIRRNRARQRRRAQKLEALS